MKGIAVIIAALSMLGAGLAAQAESPFAVYKSESAFEDVMEGLKMGIQGNGMYINNVMHMGEMLERTGKDLGATEQLYLKAESIEFCSAVLSRRMAGENPARIVNCPFIMSVYVKPDEPDTTYIVHRRVNLGDESDVMQDVESMLEALAEEAVEGF